MPAVQPRSPEVYLNLNVRGMGPSATLAINERSRQLQTAGEDADRNTVLASKGRVGSRTGPASSRAATQGEETPAADFSIRRRIA